MLAVVVCLQTVFLFSSCQSSTAKEAGVKNVLKETGGPTQESRDGVGEERSTSSPRSVTLAFTGDVLMGTNFPDSSYVTRDRGRSLFVDCADILRGADLAIGNLEGACYYGTEGEVKKKMTATSRCFVFRMPGDHARRLAEAGFDAMGVANNHAGDFGPTGRRLTVENLRSVGVQVSGQKGLAEEVVMERHGVRYVWNLLRALLLVCNPNKSSIESTKRTGGTKGRSSVKTKRSKRRLQSNVQELCV